MGGLLLFAAVIAWGTALMMSPHGEVRSPTGTEHVRTVVVIFVRNSAIGTLVLCGAVGLAAVPGAAAARRRRATGRSAAVLGGPGR